jgi:peptide/nickel transport system permease protein
MTSRNERGTHVSQITGPPRAVDIILSLLLPGMGHLVRGFWEKALVFFGVVIVAGTTLGLAVSKYRLAWLHGPSDYWFSTLLLLLLLAGVWVLGVVDLFRSTRSKTEAEHYVLGYWQMATRRFSKDAKGIIGLLLIALVVHIALFAPFFASGHAVKGEDGYVRPIIHAIKMDLYNFRAAPSGDHPLGTDNFGRDVLDRLIYGTRVALGIGFVSTILNMVFGGFLGLIGGYFRGITDSVLMRVLEVVNLIPFLVLVLLIRGLWPDGGIVSLMVILGIFGLQPARIIRSEVLSVREKDYVTAARAIGAPTWRILLKYVLPNALASLIVVTTMSIGVNIIVVAGLSFLGYGVPPPTPSWGAMLQEAQEYMRTAWWMAVYPGLAIVITVFGFNILGDSLRDVLDPRLK